MSPLRPLPRPTPTVAALLSSVQTPRHTARPSERCGNMAPPAGRRGPAAGPLPSAFPPQGGPCAGLCPEGSRGLYRVFLSHNFYWAEQGDGSLSTCRRAAIMRHGLPGGHGTLTVTRLTQHPKSPHAPGTLGRASGI